MLPFQPPFSNQNQVRGGNDPSANPLPSSSSAVPNQFGLTNPQMLMPTTGEFQNQNALLGTLLAQQQLIQGLQNNLMAALSQQGLIPQFPGQHINLLGGLQNPNLMSIQQTGLLGRPPLSPNPNQVMGRPPNGFLSQQNPNLATNPQIPMIGSGNPNPAFLGTINPQVGQSISNSPCQGNRNPHVGQSISNSPCQGNRNPQVGQSISNSPCQSNRNPQVGQSLSNSPYQGNRNPQVGKNINNSPHQGNRNPQVGQSISNISCQGNRNPLVGQIISNSPCQGNRNPQVGQNISNSPRQGNSNPQVGQNISGFPCQGNKNPQVGQSISNIPCQGNRNPQVGQSISNSPCQGNKNPQVGQNISNYPRQVNKNPQVGQNISGSPCQGNRNPQVGQNISGSPCQGNRNPQVGQSIDNISCQGNRNPQFVQNISNIPCQGNINPQVGQNISNSPCPESLASQNIKGPITPIQNNQSSGQQWPQLTHNQVGGKSFYSPIDNVASNSFKTKFNGSVRFEPSHVRYQKPQPYNPKNAWKKEGSFPRNVRPGQRPRNQRNTKLTENNNTFMRKRPLAVIYNESEVQQWRESRKKNFPTRANIEKKLSSKEEMVCEAKALRQQLREVLAKQAELGFEVPEIPKIYLTEPEEQASRNTNVNKQSNMDAQSQTNRSNNKRGSFQRENRNAKRRKFKGKPSPANEPFVKKREPTLLRKLLNADIRRDKSQLLQAFRFFVLNSFFSTSSSSKLEFPIITAKDSQKLCRNDLSLLKNESPLDPDIVAAEKLPETVGRDENGEEVESDSDDFDGAVDVVCEAIAEDFAAGGEKSEEGEITE